MRISVTNSLSKKVLWVKVFKSDIDGDVFFYLPDAGCYLDPKSTKRLIKALRWSQQSKKRA